jgi:thiamine-phosphate pyrophosphorylase
MSNFPYSTANSGRIINPDMQQSVYRIIDANFNRAREAIRVMEEFCRFAINSQHLTERTKQIRHRLCGAFEKLDTGRLIASRDTIGDVGVGRMVEKQLQRENLKDCLTAACKRFTEALRVLAEMTQTLQPSVAATIEDLRYTAYTLEKDIVLFADSAERFRPVALYVIISSSLPVDVISLTYRCVAGGADCIQLRAKDAEDMRLFALAEEFDN